MDPRELDIEKAWLLNARTDPEAFLFFYEKYHDRIYRLCYRRVLDRDFAEDLVNETFLRAQLHLDRFRWQGLTMGAWFYRIALNQISYRTRSRRAFVELDPADKRLAADPEDPLAALILAEDELRLRSLLNGLDPEYRETLRLRYWDGLTVREIAVVLDRPEGTIKARLKRGRDRLGSLMAADKRSASPREGRPSPDDLP